jgi:putative hydroxymethylpyrimidine transport system substrate-binding protein
VPNAVHTGVYCALERGYYERDNLELEVVEPTSTSDTLKLIDQGKAAFGLADGIDVGQQIDRGLDAKGIMAVVQRPLGGVITLGDSGIRSPRELEGTTVGVTGVPSDDAVLDTVVDSDGGDPGEVDRVTIGFNTVPALQAGRVDAITGYPPADGTALEHRGQEVRSFMLDKWGGPRYPGLVAFSTRRRIDRDPELMTAFVDATARG